MPAKTTALTLEEIWDLEDKYTAFAGSASGAKGVGRAGLPGRAGAARESQNVAGLKVAEDRPEE